MIEKRLIEKLLPPEEGGKRLKQSGLKRPYSDPTLRNRKSYIAFLKRLQAANLISFRRTFRRKVGAFAVWKKSSHAFHFLKALMSGVLFTDGSALWADDGQWCKLTRSAR